MAEDAARAGHEEDKDEVEAHKRTLAATDEAESDDEDVEAHRRANEEPKSDEAEGDDDVEAHQRRLT